MKKIVSCPETAVIRLFAVMHIPVLPSENKLKMAKFASVLFNKENSHCIIAV